MPKHNFRKIDALFLKLLENCISDEEIEILDNLFAGDPSLMNYYCEFVNNYIALKIKFNNEIEMNHETVGEHGFDMKFWQEASEYEKTAPTIGTPKEELQQELIHNVVYPPQEKWKINKFNLYFAIISSAALFFVVLFLKFAPQKSYSVEVANLVDQVNVKWGESLVPLKTGCRLWTNSPPYVLEKGIVSILYDEGIKVVIEAPAKFEIERSGIFLEYGRLFSHVSKSGLGFRVETTTCQFVDLGTEFGVKADIDGSSELHVIKGKVQLFAGADNNEKISQTVNQDNAVVYDANNRQTKDIPVLKTIFVRQIDSASNALWRGQEIIDLADIVGGGNGFGTGTMGYGYHLETGRQVEQNVSGAYKRQKDYIPLPSSNFIDGIFIPDGNKDQHQRISTQGHIFDQCPDTSGTCPSFIVNHVNDIIYNDQQRSCKSQLNDIIYGTRERPCIYTHSNAGITFDLDAIRKSSPGVIIKHFRMTCGIPQDNPRPNAKSNVYVLIDGQSRYSREDLTASSGSVSVNLNIEESDRFLTLLVTENNDSDSFDLILFAEPVLELETHS